MSKGGKITLVVLAMLLIIGIAYYFIFVYKWDGINAGITEWKPPVNLTVTGGGTPVPRG